MEQDFGSECSSECESGWTLYLGHSMCSFDPLQYSRNDEAVDDDDDDMSMVSDASSGPPHVQEHECDNNGVNKTSFHRDRKIQDFPTFLDDASTTSPFFEFSYVCNGKSSAGEGSNFAADYSEGESRFQDQFAYVSSSVSGTQLQQKNKLRKP